VVNHLQEPTAIHWHGIELDSYSDGVPGFGGTAGSVTPPVAPGGTFTARFTPPRAGTFIYHTHWHNSAQLAGGIYGPLIVLEPVVVKTCAAFGSAASWAQNIARPLEALVTFVQRRSMSPAGLTASDMSRAS